MPAKKKITIEQRAYHSWGWDVVSVDEEDVVPVSREGADTQWHNFNAYKGVKFECRKCSRLFSFTANEQKAWREEYGFSVHSFPHHCRACREDVRALLLLEKRKMAVLSRKEFTQADFDELVEVAMTLKAVGKLDCGGQKFREKLVWASKRSKHPRRQELLDYVKRVERFRFTDECREQVERKFEQSSRDVEKARRECVDLLHRLRMQSQERGD